MRSTWLSIPIVDPRRQKQSPPRLIKHTPESQQHGLERRGIAGQMENRVADDHGPRRHRRKTHVRQIPPTGRPCGLCFHWALGSAPLRPFYQGGFSAAVASCSPRTRLRPPMAPQSQSASFAYRAARYRCCRSTSYHETELKCRLTSSFHQTANACIHRDFASNNRRGRSGPRLRCNLRTGAVWWTRSIRSHRWCSSAWLPG